MHPQNFNNKKQISTCTPKTILPPAPVRRFLSRFLRWFFFFSLKMDERHICHLREVWVSVKCVGECEVWWVSVIHIQTPRQIYTFNQGHSQGEGVPFAPAPGSWSFPPPKKRQTKYDFLMWPLATGMELPWEYSNALPTGKTRVLICERIVARRGLLLKAPLHVSRGPEALLGYIRPCFQCYRGNLSQGILQIQAVWYHSAVYCERWAMTSVESHYTASKVSAVEFILFSGIHSFSCKSSAKSTVSLGNSKTRCA